MQLGMVGLGRMGRAMARRLLVAGHECVVHDRAADVAATLAERGAVPASSLGELVAALQPPRQVVDLNEVTRGMVDNLGDNHPSIVFRVDGESSLVRGAPGRVSRAVSNLVDNAAKWSPSGAEVEIAVRDGTVSVRDHGPGVDPADLPHVFDRFYRSPAARTMPGSGLGLAIVKQVADSHGGSVTATAAPGGGALLVLQLPTVDGAGRTDVDVPTGFSSTS